MAQESVLDNLVRIGTVSSVGTDGRKVRVLFQDKGITSGWLSVLQHRVAGVYVKENEDVVSPHTHKASVTVWMPAINDTVVVLYLPVFNGDGFVLGVI